MAEAALSSQGLVIDGLVSGYGGGVVIDGLSLTVAKGTSLAVLGRNGAGKTTLLRTIMGLNRAKAGSIVFEGRRIDRKEPFEIARAGIGYVPQGREIFGELTVEENLFLGNLKATEADAVYALFPALAEKRRVPGGRLSGGQQQQLAIGRALMADPRLLLLDEPSEGIQPSVVAEIVEILGRIVRERGMSLVLVEQNIDMAMALAERIALIEHGRVAATDTTAALKANPRLIEEFMAI
jgi:urea ABC transporter ATP-binding protein UrtE